MTPEPFAYPAALDAGSLSSLFPLEVSVSHTLLVALFALSVVFWAVMTVIFLYHWRRFPFGVTTLRWVERGYLGVSGLFILLALGGVFAL